MSIVHGSFQFEISGSVIVIQARGPWNENCVSQYQQQYHALQQGFGGKPYGELLSIIDEGLLIPEAYEQLRDGLKYSVKNGLVCTAVMLDKCSSRFCTQRQFKQLYADTGVNSAFFQEQDAALLWLKAYKLNCAPQDALFKAC